MSVWAWCSFPGSGPAAGPTCARLAPRNHPAWANRSKGLKARAVKAWAEASPTSAGPGEASRRSFRGLKGRHPATWRPASGFALTGLGDLLPSSTWGFTPGCHIAGFQPLSTVGPATWAVGPGWYEHGPLALKGTPDLWVILEKAVRFYRSQRREQREKGWKRVRVPTDPSPAGWPLAMTRIPHQPLVLRSLRFLL